MSPHAGGISKSFLSVSFSTVLMPTGFLAKSTYTPTLKFNGVTGMLNLPVLEQDSKNFIQYEKEIERNEQRATEIKSQRETRWDVIGHNLLNR